MPTLIRITMTLCVLVAAIYGAMYLLVIFLEPAPRPMVERVSPKIFSGIEEARKAAAEEEIDPALRKKLKVN